MTHWGKHKVEAAQGVIEPGKEDHELLNGVKDVFGDSDVYEAYPPNDVEILLRGLVLESIAKGSKPAQHEKRRASDGKMQKVNNPAMPIAWTREVENDAGGKNRVLTTTMGAATDLLSEDLRRLVVNGVYWGLGMEVPEKAEVSIVGDYNPSNYGFEGFKKGAKAEDLVE